MPDAPPPKRDKDNLGAIARILGYVCIITFGWGALGFDDPRTPDQYFSPLHWGRRANQSIANFFGETR
ncbi:hypothetical protein H6F75_00625 [Nodosilinea sp. FACHB-131]|uniref:hypothetical protein n=1 Tax=Cyanophyceae TaxID=3028117 RepID=UPI001683410C|nr:hypothetical protein [Nodosilinea sp. FACHB-131]MBD1871975.1 hypothetical protein [Nodosilinea sp. FACHB-131]